MAEKYKKALTAISFSIIVMNRDYNRPVLNQGGEPMAISILQDQVRRYWESWQELSALYEEYAKSLGLSYTSLQILSFITSNQGKCTQKMICQKTFLPKQTINTVITGFLRQGLIQLVEQPSDRRSKTILLTEAGREYTGKIIPRIRNAEYKAMEQLNEKQRVALLEITEMYVEGCREAIKAD